MFELRQITECRLTAFVGRTQREGKEDVPAVSFRLLVERVSNEWLDMFSPTLRGALYKAVEGQESIPGVESTMPLLRSSDVTHLSPEFRYEGWKVWLARGLDDGALQMERSKIDDFQFTLYEGGLIDFDFRVSTADLDEEGAGMLWGRQKRKVFVRIEAPELPANGSTEATGAAIDGTTAAFQADHPGFDFDAENGGQAPEVTPESAFAAAVAEDASADDDGAAEQAEIEAGMTASVEKSKRSKKKFDEAGNPFGGAVVQ